MKKNGVAKLLFALLAAIILTCGIEQLLLSSDAAPRRQARPHASGKKTARHRQTARVVARSHGTGKKTARPRHIARVVVARPHERSPQPYDIMPGVRHKQWVQRVASGPVHINMLEVDLKNAQVSLMPVLAAGKMGAKSSVSGMVSGYGAIAGINGSFFKPDVGIPLGILMINQELISGPLYDRVALGITSDNRAMMSRIHLVGDVALPDGRKVPIHNLNQPRTRRGATVVYSPRWGWTAPKIPPGGMQIQLKNNRVVGVSQSRPMPIPRNGVVISGPPTPAMLALSLLPPERTVELNLHTLPDWSGMKHAIGGGPWLVKNGRPYVDTAAQNFKASSLGFREPRSAVGITHNGKLLLVTADGRQKKVSIGMTLGEMAGLMRRLGVVNAMNLDGGSSTQMSIYGKTVNRPSAGNIGVSNALIIVGGQNHIASQVDFNNRRQR